MTIILVLIQSLEPEFGCGPSARWRDVADGRLMGCALDKGMDPANVARIAMNEPRMTGLLDIQWEWVVPVRRITDVDVAIPVVVRTSAAISRIGRMNLVVVVVPVRRLSVSRIRVVVILCRKEHLDQSSGAPLEVHIRIWHDGHRSGPKSLLEAEGAAVARKGARALPPAFPLGLVFIAASVSILEANSGRSPKGYASYARSSTPPCLVEPVVGIAGDYLREAGKRMDGYSWSWAGPK